MQIIPRHKLKYKSDKIGQKRRNIRKTNRVLRSMKKDMLMISVCKSNRHMQIIISNNNNHTIKKYSTTQYIDKNNKQNHNYCNSTFATKLAKDTVNNIKQLPDFKGKIVFNSGPYKYHGNIKIINEIIKEFDGVFMDFEIVKEFLSVFFWR
ncbi:MAG: 50S ribosomal protein L18 [Pseudomonadota bacterium]